MALMRRRYGGEHPLVRMQDEMSNMFQQFFREPFLGSELLKRTGQWDWVPRVNIEETAKEYIVQAEVPGIDPKDVAVQLQGNTLTISGEKKAEEERQDSHFHVVERKYGSFQRSLYLPENADLVRIVANGQYGVLKITIPKKEQAQPKVIKVDTE